VQRILVETAYTDHHPDADHAADEDLGLTISPDRLAYIYFTSA
jgi:hypothetical protein